MASSKTTGKAPVLQVSALTIEEHQVVLQLAKEEDRTLSKMGANLILEALAARGLTPNHSKEAAKG